jgi:glycosyltransferase involved in cell wall biosynthesis
MISDVYFPRVNGVSTSIATFRQELQQLGHQVCLIAPDYGTGDETGDDIIRIPSRYLVLDPEDRMLKSGKILALEETLEKRKFDLIHIQTPFIAHRVGVRLARRLKLPVVETCHTYFEEYLYYYVPLMPRSYMQATARWLTRRQCNNVDAVIVPSRAMHDVLVRYGVTSSVSIIPTGIEIDEFRAGSGERFCRNYNIDPARPTLVHIGRVAHEKNIGFLLDVLAQVRRHIPEVLLIIAGEGPAGTALRRKVRDLGIQRNVRFVGYLPRGAELCDCYRAGDAFVFASATETQGLVILEAMALGVPVVSTAVMGTRDILGPARGALVATGTIADFTGKILLLLNDAALRERLGTAAREYAREWSAGIMAGRLAEFYAGILDWDDTRFPGETGDVTVTG